MTVSPGQPVHNGCLGAYGHRPGRCWGCSRSPGSGLATWGGWLAGQTDRKRDGCVVGRPEGRCCLVGDDSGGVACEGGRRAVTVRVDRRPWAPRLHTCPLPSCLRRPPQSCTPGFQEPVSLQGSRAVLSPASLAPLHTLSCTEVTAAPDRAHSARPQCRVPGRGQGWARLGQLLGGGGAEGRLLETRPLAPAPAVFPTPAGRCLQEGPATPRAPRYPPALPVLGLARPLEATGATVPLRLPLLRLKSGSYLRPPGGPAESGGPPAGETVPALSCSLLHASGGDPSSSRSVAVPSARPAGRTDCCVSFLSVSVPHVSLCSLWRDACAPKPCPTEVCAPGI